MKRDEKMSWMEIVSQLEGRGETSDEDVNESGGWRNKTFATCFTPKETKDWNVTQNARMWESCTKMEMVSDCNPGCHHTALIGQCTLPDDTSRRTLRRIAIAQIEVNVIPNWTHPFSSHCQLCVSRTQTQSCVSAWNWHWMRKSNLSAERNQSKIPAKIYCVWLNMGANGTTLKGARH